MTQRSLGIAWLVLILLGSLSGCEWWEGEEQGEFDESLLDPPSAAETTEDVPSRADEKLQLRLKPGDRFPLEKTVTQTLTQNSPGGPATSRSKLELLLAITVEEIRDDRKRLAVLYQHVRYRHDVAGQVVEYDSNSPPVPVPLQVQAYHGLVNNGFSFWIGPDYKVIELVGFNDFLERCVRGVLPADRQAVLASLSVLSGDEGIANFVDDSIGLLPAGIGGNRRDAVLEIGSSWSHQRQLTQPIPMYVSSDCTLTELNDDIAEIGIAGTITPLTAYVPSEEQNRDVRVTLRGGRSVGRCTIDRSSGLPLNSQIERRLDMVVQLADGSQFEQQKHIVTTIRAFPQQASIGTLRPRTLPGIVPNPPARIPPPNRVVEAAHETGPR